MTIPEFCCSVEGQEKEDFIIRMRKALKRKMTTEEIQHIITYTFGKMIGSKSAPHRRSSAPEFDDETYDTNLDCTISRFIGLTHAIFGLDSVFLKKTVKKIFNRSHYPFINFFREARAIEHLRYKRKYKKRGLEVEE